jgi:hypothetical protein
MVVMLHSILSASAMMMAFLSVTAVQADKAKDGEQRQAR